MACRRICSAWFRSGSVNGSGLVIGAAGFGVDAVKLSGVLVDLSTIPA
jgi:hypothetical protein